jgi:dolichyl-phosphate-mannose-protein mannosyltransferase
MLIHYDSGVHVRVSRNTMFFIGAWACHYLPFFLMSRQLFLHHYLPAHLASALVAGTVLNFVLSGDVNYPVSKPGLTTRLRPVVRVRTGLVGVLVIALLIAALVGMFFFLSPLTYGTPS